MKNLLLSVKLYLLGALIGGIGGLLYWKYVGCYTGSCAITSNPGRSTAYFAFFGALILGSFNKKKSKTSETETSKN